MWYNKYDKDKFMTKFPLTNEESDINLQDIYTCKDCGAVLSPYSNSYGCKQDSTRRHNVDGQMLKIGVKKDEGKARFELLAYEVLQAVARILTEGAKKYEDRNWEKGIAYGRIFGAVQRHLAEWWNAPREGQDGINHADGKESHLDHAICGLMFLSAYEKRGMVTFDDRPKN